MSAQRGEPHRESKSAQVCGRLSVREVECKARGNESLKMKDYAAAVRYYSEAIEAVPQSSTSLAIVYANRSAADLAMGEIEKAIADGRAATMADPGYCKGFFRLGRALRAGGHFMEAAEMFCRIASCGGLGTMHSEVQKCIDCQQAFEEACNSILARGHVAAADRLADFLNLLDAEADQDVRFRIEFLRYSCLAIRAREIDVLAARAYIPEVVTQQIIELEVAQMAQMAWKRCKKFATTRAQLVMSRQAQTNTAEAAAALYVELGGALDMWKDSHVSGLIRLTRHCSSESVAWYALALEIQPRALQYRVHLAMMLRQQGRIDESLALLQKGICLEEEGPSPCPSRDVLEGKALHTKAYCEMASCYISKMCQSDFAEDHSSDEEEDEGDDTGEDTSEACELETNKTEKRMEIRDLRDALGHHSPKYCELLFQVSWCMIRASEIDHALADLHFATLQPFLYRLKAQGLKELAHSVCASMAAIAKVEELHPEFDIDLMLSLFARVPEEWWIHNLPSEELTEAMVQETNLAWDMRAQRKACIEYLLKEKTLRELRQPQELLACSASTDDGEAAPTGQERCHSEAPQPSFSRAAAEVSGLPR
jgi:tetratricopeptide (TPR) repeat protein